MEHLSFDRLLMHQTLVVHELGLYMRNKDYIAHPREFLLLDGIRSRSEEVRQLSLNLKKEFWQRAKND